MKRTLKLTVFACLATAIVVAAGTASASAAVLQQAVLTAPDKAASDFLGTSVAVDGDTAIVGASGCASGTGAAYVYVRSGPTWSLQQKLTASDGTTDSYFGCSVAIDGDTVVIGASRAAPGPGGAAYVFVREGTTWTQQQRLDGEGGEGDAFGTSVAIDGTTIVVGAGRATGGAPMSGAAYVFVRSGGAWTQQQKLSDSSSRSLDFFGNSVAVSGNTALVGAPDRDNDGATDGGAVYFFERIGTTWYSRTMAVAMIANTCLGASVALDGDRALAGATGFPAGSVTAAGAVMPFHAESGSWSLDTLLTASDAARGDRFGSSVALSGDTAVVGAMFASPSSLSAAGVAYSYARSGTTWTQSAKLTASDQEADNSFGASVAVSDSTALVGALNASPGSVDMAGEAYVFVSGVNAPTITITGADSSWHKSALTLGVTAAGDTALTLSKLEYSTDGSTWTKMPGSGNTRNLTISADGTTNVTVRATDSAAQTATDSATVRIDSTPPTLTLAKSRLAVAKGKRTLSVRLRWNDDLFTTGRLCVAITRYGRQKTEVSWVTLRKPGVWQTINVPWVVERRGHYNLHLFMYDEVGNQSRTSAVIVAQR